VGKINVNVTFSRLSEMDIMQPVYIHSRVCS
jgi:hypothetical protein